MKPGYTITPKGYVYVRMNGNQHPFKISFTEFEPLWERFNAWIGEQVRSGKLEEGPVENIEFFWTLWERYQNETQAHAHGTHRTGKKL